MYRIALEPFQACLALNMGRFIKEKTSPLHLTLKPVVTLSVGTEMERIVTFAVGSGSTLDSRIRMIFSVNSN